MSSATEQVSKRAQIDEGDYCSFSMICFILGLNVIIATYGVSLFFFIAPFLFRLCVSAWANFSCSSFLALCFPIFLINLSVFSSIIAHTDPKSSPCARLVLVFFFQDLAHTYDLLDLILRRCGPAELDSI
ncbi:hypothetical protein DFJ43DRAFT_1067382 [Lentinula guzmanii]|uniref:Uncharacterized protein n=1 Tax=Lentinula guzmanii TaxID=2804957 RepID=A0AA38JKC3_9AGAR|nr:hypothetical protein DFJ43DRAFT_1067382 [Lentinula guzmanii]